MLSVHLSHFLGTLHIYVSIPMRVGSLVWIEQQLKFICRESHGLLKKIVVKCPKQNTDLDVDKTDAENNWASVQYERGSCRTMYGQVLLFLVTGTDFIRIKLPSTL